MQAEATQAKSQAEQSPIFLQNKKLLGKNEYVVPDNVLMAFKSVVDTSGLLGKQTIPEGVTLHANFLESKFLRMTFRGKERKFLSKLKKLGYSQQEAEHHVSVFVAGNIIFSHSGTMAPDFELGKLAHERLHMRIHNLPKEQANVLNEARDAILAADSRMLEKQTDEIGLVLKKEKNGELTAWQAYEEKNKLSESHPMILKENSKTSSIPGFFEMTVRTRPIEFYTYMLMGRLDPSVEQYVKEHYPKSYAIYDSLRSSIMSEIEEAKKK